MFLPVANLRAAARIVSSDSVRGMTHVQLHFVAFVLFSEARDRQFQSTISIRANTAEASRSPRRFLMSELTVLSSFETLVIETS
ncbi:unnamed protein product [Merluccius merluccius]